MNAERDLVSYFYVGRNENVKDYLMPKIGETKQELKKRAKDIRAHEEDDKHFKMLGCLILFNATQAERRLIESDVRVRMEKYGKNVKNDHFLIKAKAKKYRDAQYMAFALIALGYAMDCCEREHFPYIVKIF